MSFASFIHISCNNQWTLYPVSIPFKKKFHWIWQRSTLLKDISWHWKILSVQILLVYYESNINFFVCAVKAAQGWVAQQVPVACACVWPGREVAWAVTHAVSMRRGIISSGLLVTEYVMSFCVHPCIRTHCYCLSPFTESLPIAILR